MSESFRRARTEEQRELRRTAILEIASEALRELGVDRLTLGEISRRVGLAKSNVLRYFESREALLLQLLNDALDEWMHALDAELGSDDGSRDAPQQASRLVDAIVATLSARPVLCDLLSAQAAVLERNVSVEMAANYKRDMIDGLGRLTRTVCVQLPGLSPNAAAKFAAAVLLMAGALWDHANPSEAMRAAYRRDPQLAALELRFGDALGGLLAPLLTGIARDEAAW